MHGIDARNVGNRVCIAAVMISPAAAGILNTKESAMNWDRVEGNWKEFKGKVKQQWGDLTDDDLTVIEGNRDELAGHLQKRYGYAKDKARQEINSWLDGV